MVNRGQAKSHAALWGDEVSIGQGTVCGLLSSSGGGSLSSGARRRSIVWPIDQVLDLRPIGSFAGS